jgi:hypothetical protein
MEEVIVIMEYTSNKRIIAFAYDMMIYLILNLGEGKRHLRVSEAQS